MTRGETATIATLIFVLGLLTGLVLDTLVPRAPCPYECGPASAIDGGRPMRLCVDTPP